MEVQKEELTEHADVDVEPGTVATIMAVFVNIMLFLTFFNLKKITIYTAIITLFPAGEWSIVSMCVCVPLRVSVCRYISRTAWPMFTEFFVHVTYGPG